MPQGCKNFVLSDSAEPGTNSLDGRTLRVFPCRFSLGMVSKG
jgi:hypothetical protein